jgi:hypothetical protein
MRRLALTATFAAALAIPACAAAASNAVVLSVNSTHHQIQVVDTHHLVHAYGYAGHLPKLHAGTKIGFSRSGGRISHVRIVSSKSRSVSFYAKVVRSSARGVVLSLADGANVSFSASQLAGHSAKHHKHAVRSNTAGSSVNIQGLEPGVAVLVAETGAPDGSVAITISFPSSSSSAPGVGSELQANGVVTGVDTDAFVLTPGDGSDLRLHMPADALANLDLQTCDTAAVTYHQDGGTLIADTVKMTGSSTSGDCAGSSGGGPSGGGSTGDDQDVIGAITQISDTSVTINVPNQRPMTIEVDPSLGLTDGFIPGDTVDVTYFANGDGTYSADDIEYDDQDTTGTVTSVSDSSVTLTDDSNGQPVTFTVNPGDGYLDGVSVGDQIDVTYYLNAGNTVVDWVDDLTTD